LIFFHYFCSCPEKEVMEIKKV